MVIKIIYENSYPLNVYLKKNQICGKIKISSNKKNISVTDNTFKKALVSNFLQNEKTVPPTAIFEKLLNMR